MQKFQALIKKEVEFPVVISKNLSRNFRIIYEECNTTVQDFQGLIFILSATIKGKERKKKYLEIT